MSEMDSSRICVLLTSSTFHLTVAVRIAEPAVQSTHVKRKEINMKSSQMIIGEAVSDVAVKEIVNLMQEHVRDVPGVNGHSILVEEGGLMVVLITGWLNRQDCVAYHASKAYRRLVAATQHLLIGSYVVKLFQNRNDVGS